MHTLVFGLALGRVVAGFLSQPAPQVKPETIAEQFIASHRALVVVPRTTLEAPTVRRLHNGAVVTLRQQHRGVPVIGASVVLRIDAEGRVRRVSASTLDLGTLDVTPRLSADAAVSVARAAGAAGERDPASTTLAVDPRAAGGPRLVWAVRLVPVPQLLENAIYLLDANDGRLLRRIDLIKYAKALVFRQSPGEQETPMTVDIPAPFEPTDPDKFLVSPLLEALNCIDKDEQTKLMGLDVHICSVTHSAKGDDGGDYTAYMPAGEPWTAPMNGCPNAPLPNDDRQPLDEFAEQHMYWHVANAYDFFRGLFSEGGLADWTLRQKPFPVAVNLCIPNLSGGLGNLNGPLVPFDNAFYSPGMNNPISQALLKASRDAVMFGQGTSFDFAYDGDVVVHEFTHAVIDTLGKLIEGAYEDEQGANDDPGSMNEGLADYFAGALGGGALIGEYAGRNFAGQTGVEGGLRTMENDRQCAVDRIGEVHEDSIFFSAALWAARTAVAGKPGDASFDAAVARKFDLAVLQALQALGDFATMGQMGQGVAEEAEMLIGAGAKKAVQDSFTSRGIWPECERVVTWNGQAKQLLLIDGGQADAKAPSHVQFKVVVEPGQDTITLHTNLRQTGGGGFLGNNTPPMLELAVSPPDEKFIWQPGMGKGNEIKTAAFSGAQGEVTASVSGLMPGTYHLMILNGGGSVVATKISFETACGDAAGCMPPADMAIPNGGDNNASGCDCDVGGARGGFPLASLAALLLLVLFARRRA